MGIVRKKAGIIGVGKVGATLAFYLAVEHICDDLLLIGRNAEKIITQDYLEKVVEMKRKRIFPGEEYQEEQIANLTGDQICACISLCVRQDHFDCGTRHVGNGSYLRLMKAFLYKTAQ